jgi:periplasmic protein TonB
MSQPKQGASGSSTPLGYALLLATTLHGLVLLGVGLAHPDRPRLPAQSTLQIVLVKPQRHPPAAPLAAQLLAQESSRPAAPKAQAQPTPAPRPATPEERPPMRPATAAPASPPPTRAQTPAKGALTASRHRPVRAHRPPAWATRSPAAPSPPVALPPPVARASAAQVLASVDQEIALISADLDRKSNAYAQRPRRRAVSAATKEYKYAAYLDTWRRKVERIGNLNYPEEARRDRLHGDLVLHVAVRADGSVQNIRVVHSSGQPILDRAAVRIVRMAAPFAPFPPGIRQEVDILDITRTWQFLSDNRLEWK